MIELKIGVSEDRKQVSRFVGLSQEVLGDLSDIWDEYVHPWLIEHEEDVFETEGAHGGESWAGYDNEPNYVAYKLSQVGHLDLLRWEKGGKYERLYPGLTQPSHPRHIWRSNDQEFAYGVRLSYASRLARGGIGPFGERYPGRPPIVFTREQKAHISTLMQRGVRDRLGDDALRAGRVIL